MSGREPEWFRPEPFCRQVLHFALRELNAMGAETAEQLTRYPERFREGVQIVGRAVFTLQLVIRRRLIYLFIEIINIIALEGRRGIYREIFSFMSQSYLCGDIFKTTLSCFAIVAELIVFMYDLGNPLPAYWYPMPWCAIYEHRLRRELESNGGWERLLEITNRRYGDTGFNQEASLDFENRNRVAHAERRGRNNWPDNPLEFLHQRFEVAPRSTTLAMMILREIYHHEQNLIPFPGAGAHEVRIMLGLLDLEEEDGWV